MEADQTERVEMNEYTDSEIMFLMLGHAADIPATSVYMQEVHGYGAAYVMGHWGT